MGLLTGILEKRACNKKLEAIISRLTTISKTMCAEDQVEIEALIHWIQKDMV